jgi:hypothetical protein
MCDVLKNFFTKLRSVTKFSLKRKIFKIIFVESSVNAKNPQI